MRADHPSSDTICDAIDRFLEHGHAFVAGEYTFLHHLEAHGVPSAIFRDAQAALVREETEGTRTMFATLDKKWKRSPSPAQNAPAASRSIRLPITAPLDEPAFKELCEVVRDFVAVMDQGCEMLAKRYRGHPVPPDVQKDWHDAIARAQQCRPLLDGTFSHADHLRAWGIDPSTYVAGQSAEVSDQSSARMSAGPSSMPPTPQQATQLRPEPLRSSKDMQADPQKRLPAAAENEFAVMLGRYMDHSRREQVEEEIRNTDWPAHVQDAALQRFWSMAGKVEPSAPRPPIGGDPPANTRVSVATARARGSCSSGHSRPA
jgi:cell division septation protein DedD